MISGELWERLISFQKAANELTEQWSAEGSEVLVDYYPFEKSFDEVASDIDNWTRATMYIVLRKAVGDEKHYPIFMYGGVAIGNPFLSDNGMEEVDPIDFYGLDTVKKAVKEITFRAASQC